MTMGFPQEPDGYALPVETPVTRRGFFVFRHRVMENKHF